VNVAFVSPEPTPYRAPLLDRVAEHPDIDLTAIYAAQTVASRAWSVEIHHRTIFLNGIPLPGGRRIVRHDYPLTPDIFGALKDADPDVVVVSGWSTFAAQGAIAWCRMRRVPFVLLVESHDAGPKSGWRRQVKETVVPQIVRRAASVLVVGSLARDSVVALGADLARVRTFANTIDVQAYAERVDRLAARRPKLRSSFGLADDDVAVVSVARLAREKGLDTMLRAAEVSGVRPVIVGSGPERERLAKLAPGAVLTGELPQDRVAEAYAAADVFCLLSTHEPWGVAVNEAAAAGLPLVLSDRVGAAADLLRDGENGMVVAAGDVAGAAEAFRRLAANPGLRRAYGARSREIIAAWGYGPSVEALVEACREATAAR
jgi:glycosyltransferase involved in cell wall biosynthesis